jgi:hypothetical protein
MRGWGITSTPERGFSRLSEPFFLGVCGTRSMFCSQALVLKMGILIPIFFNPSSILCSSSNILAALKRGNSLLRVPSKNASERLNRA